MSTAQAIRAGIRGLPRGKPFTNARFFKHGASGTVNRTLSRLVREGQIQRVSRGIFVRPRTSRFVGTVLPGVQEVVEAVARSSGETVQVQRRGSRQAAAQHPLDRGANASAHDSDRPHRADSHVKPTAASSARAESYAILAVCQEHPERGAMSPCEVDDALIERRVMNLGRHKHLMLDDSIIDSSRGVALRSNPARATGEVLLQPDNGTEVYAYSSVRSEGGRVRLWYDARSRFATCYAESDDGIHFTTPELNLLGPELPANAVMAMHRLQGCCVWIDPQAPPERRYKSQAKCGPHPDRPHTLEFFASPDGLEWEHLHGIRIEDCDTQNVVFWDESYGRYVMYTRLWVRDDDPNRNHRKVRRLESDDLRALGLRKRGLGSGRGRPWRPTAPPPACRRSTTTGRAVSKYPEADDLYLCLAEAFWHFKDRPESERWGFSPDPATLNRTVERLAPSTMDVYLATAATARHSAGRPIGGRSCRSALTAGSTPGGCGPCRTPCAWATSCGSTTPVATATTTTS